MLTKSKVDFGIDVNKEAKCLSLYTCTDTSGNRTILHSYLEKEV